MDYNNPPLDPNDPLGTDLALDSNGDLILTPQGDVQTVSELDNIKQMIRVRLQTIPDSYLFGFDLGSQLGETVDEPLSPSTQKLIEQYTINALEADPRIVQVVSVVPNIIDLDSLEVTIDVEVAGIGEVQTSIPIGGNSGV